MVSTMKPSLTIVIPAYNEAGNIEKVVAVIEEMFRVHGFSDCGIIIIDDCSTDGTGVLVDALAKKNLRVRVVHNTRNQGIGYNFKIGSELSQSEFTGYIPGDNEVTKEAISNMFAAVGPTDVVNTYIVNMEARPWIRQVISRNFTRAMNILFNMHLRYFTGPAIIRTEPLRRVKRTTFGFAFMMEIIVQLVKAGYSYVEVPMPVQPRAYGKPLQVFRPKDIWRVFKAVLAVIETVYFSSAIKKLRAARTTTS